MKKLINLIILSLLCFILIACNENKNKGGRTFTVNDMLNDDDWSKLAKHDSYLTRQCWKKHGLKPAEHSKQVIKTKEGLRLTCGQWIAKQMKFVTIKEIDTLIKQKGCYYCTKE